MRWATRYLVPRQRIDLGVVEEVIWVVAWLVGRSVDRFVESHDEGRRVVQGSILMRFFEVPQTSTRSSMIMTMLSSTGNIRWRFFRFITSVP